ncbi:MAG TPA: SurA N-terminal domain-containing protein, partial [Bryobacteraceae bacterium]|nr:SurA N-terminal domain-containing protein [Bryobacteraceae bacterium]
MFDLFRSRDKIVRIMLGGLLVVVALSMLIYLIPGYGGSMGGNSADPVVAEVGKDTITQRQVQLQVEGLIKNRQLPTQLLGVYVPQVVDQMITEHALAFEAQRLGFSVSDAELADTIRTLGGGRFTDPATYKRFVEDQGYTVPDFEQSLRDSMLTSRLESVAAKSVVVTPAEVQAEFSHRNDKIKLAYLVFAEDTLKSQIKPTADDLKGYFDQHRASYRIPEQRNATVLVVDQAKVSDSIQISDAQLHAAYNSSI